MRIINDVKKPCPNIHQGWNGKAPEGIVIHYTASGTSTADIDWFLNPESKASAHFYIDRKGNITRVVKESDRAYHAGVSSWHGKSNCNNFMFGIELDNLGKGEQYPQEQIDALKELITYLMSLWPSIDASCIVGHSHISPGRKIDPGPAFPWKQIDSFTRTKTLQLNMSIQSHIERLGYEIGNIDGIIGAKTTAALEDLKKKHNLVWSKDFELMCLLRRL